MTSQQHDAHASGSLQQEQGTTDKVVQINVGVGQQPPYRIVDDVKPVHRDRGQTQLTG